MRQTRQQQLDSLVKFKKAGKKWVCMGCHGVSVKKRGEWYEDGHNGRYIDMCRCGSDLFEAIEDTIARFEVLAKEETKEK